MRSSEDATFPSMLIRETDDALIPPIALFRNAIIVDESIIHTSWFFYMNKKRSGPISLTTKKIQKEIKRRKESYDYKQKREREERERKREKESLSVCACMYSSTFRHRSSFIIHHSSFIIHRSSFIVHHFHPSSISRKTKNSLHERLIADLNPSTAVGIQSSKSLGKLFDDNTGTDKSVKRNRRRRCTSTTRYACSFDIYPERG